MRLVVIPIIVHLVLLNEEWHTGGSQVAWRQRADEGSAVAVPWRLWITDQPNGLGNTLFTIQIFATEGK
jgi:hypothetical protein